MLARHISRHVSKPGSDRGSRPWTRASRPHGVSSSCDCLCPLLYRSVNHLWKSERGRQREDSRKRGGHNAHLPGILRQARAAKLEPLNTKSTVLARPSLSSANKLKTTWTS
eukprot:3114435-Pleurochrysis_carterae.AAC.1